MIPTGLALPFLRPYAASFNGLAFGAWSGSPYGQAFQLGAAGFAGLDLPAVRSGDTPRPRDHGEVAGLDLLAGRDITVDVIVGKTATATLQDNLRLLAAALTTGGETEQPLWIQMPDALYGCMARVRRKSFPTNQGYILMEATTVSVMFHCTDPRLYSCPTINSSVTAPVPETGITFPVSFPVFFPAGTPPATLPIMNEGNINCLPLITITGPITNPTVTLGNDPDLPMLGFNSGVSGFTLNPGDELIIDTDAKSVTLISAGTTTPVNRLNWLVPGSTWWSLQPGYNEVQFSSDDASVVDGAVTIAYASAFDSL